MINQVLNLESNTTKSIGFDEYSLYLSNIQFSTIEGLREKCGTSNKGASQSILLDRIQKITFTSGEEAISIYFQKESGKEKSFYIEGFRTESAEEFIRCLAEKSGLSGFFGKEERKQDYSKHYLSLAGVAIFTTGLAWIATLPRTGRRTHLIKLLKNIGPEPIIIVGIIAAVYIVFQMYKQKRKPANQIVYKRN